MEPTARPFRTVSVPVLAAGLATTALTLVGVYWVGSRYDGWNVMGFYANYVIPIGALIVGLLAGSGYGVASWATGFKISKGTLWAVVALQTLAYVLAQYLEYRVVASHGGALPTFLPYFDAVTRGIAFENDNGTVGQPLELLGYGVRLLELVGFVGGALMVPAGLRKKPYCETCGRYMRTKAVGVLPASVAERRMWRKSDDEKAAYEAEQETARMQGMGVHDHVFRLAQGTDGPAFAEAARLLTAGTKAAGKLPTRIPVTLSSCPTCRTGLLSSQVQTGKGNQTAATALASVHVAPALVRGLDA